MRFLGTIAFVAIAGALQAQQPFSLDTAFRTPINKVFVSSVLPLEDGRLVVSGLMNFQGISGQPSLAALEPDGSLAPDFAVTGLGRGRITPWEDGKFYVATNYAVRRVLPSGHNDSTFIEMSTDPLFTAEQGGDYHVYPDGRVLMSGSHDVSDPVRGFDGLYSLIWFSNTGYYDTTRAPRATDGAIYHIAQLENGQFYCGGAFTHYEGNTAYALVRVQPDGAYDPSFQTNILWGEPQTLCPLPDGRVMVGGDFTFQGGTDTLRLMRFLPDGSLDPIFNTSHTFSRIAPGNLALIFSITELDPDHFAVAGYFDQVDGEDHHGIAIFDSSGTLLENYFPGSGAGIWTYMNATGVTVAGIMPTGDGTDDYWIWGSYHGYDDGTTNDTLQRMVSRLHGLTVGIHEPERPSWQVQVFPNPGRDVLHIEAAVKGKVDVRVRDTEGRAVLSASAPSGLLELNSGSLSPGVYLVEVNTAQGRRTVKWTKR